MDSLPDMVVVSVRPVAAGWLLTCGPNALLQAFHSGGEAERKARQLAGLLAGAGHLVTLEVQDANGQVIGWRPTSIRPLEPLRVRRNVAP